jgi:transglutaminase-like putative cysteine protease
VSVGVPLLSILLILYSAASGVALAADTKVSDDAVVLEESIDIEIVAGDQARLHRREVVQVLTVNGIDAFESVEVRSNPWIQIRDLHGAVMPPSGKRVEMKKQAISEGADTSFELYSEDKVRTLHFSGVVPGSTIEFEYEQSFRSVFFLPDWFSLQGPMPVKRKTVTLVVPVSYPIRIAVRGGTPEYSHSEERGIVTHRWQVKDVPALKTEPYTPPGADVVPRIIITPKEIRWDDRTIDASTWDGIAAWDWDLERDRSKPTPEVEKMAAELTAGVTDPAEKTRRLYDFVRQKVNYVAIYLGIGGWQPHASGDVLRNRYGDCKDKATLLISLMHAVGLRGFPVLIMTRDVDVVDRDTPAPAFNHEIVAVPREDGTYFFMDPTAEDTPYGELPWVDQGVTVLVVKDDGHGDLVETPLVPAEKNLLHIRVTAELKPTGTLEGTYELQASGERRDLMIALLSIKQAQREQALSFVMSWFCPGAVVQSQDVKVPPDPQAPATASIRFTVPRFTIRAGAREVVTPYLVRFKDLTDIAKYPTRTVPVLFPRLFSNTSESRLQLPPGRTLKAVPADRTLNGPGISSVTHFELIKKEDRQVLVVRRSVTVTRREIPPADYAAFHTFVSSLIEEEANAVSLESEPIAANLVSPDGR